MVGSDPSHAAAAYLGPEASFSHQAAVNALPHAEAVPLPSFKAILTAVQEPTAEGARSYDYAVLPVENSTNGSVVQALDLVAQCGLDPDSSAYPNVEVVDENYLAVHHCLFVSRAWAEQYLSSEELAKLPIDLDTAATKSASLSNGTRTVPDSRVETRTVLDAVLGKLNIKTLYTHPQVWGQCTNILSAHLPPGRVDRIDLSSTSAAAAYVAQPQQHQSSMTKHTATTDADGIAAISSSLAGAKHGSALVCVALNIEDEPGANTTRFLILQNRNRPQPSGHLLPFPPTEPQTQVQIKSLWAFTIAHSVPGTLATTLAVFARHHFNLSAIQSRPRPRPRSAGGLDKAGGAGTIAQDANWRYVFFVECLHMRHQAIQHGEDKDLARLLDDLTAVTEQVTLLGSWRDRLS